MTSRRLPRLGPAALLLLLAACDSPGGKPGSPDGAALGPACPEDTASFQALVWDPVLASPCATCHVAGGAAEGTRMVFLPEGAEGWLLHNLRVATEVARLDADGVSLLVAKPTGHAAHTGGTLVNEGSAEDAALRFWASWSRGELDECTAPDDALACTATGPGARTLRRLTHDELDNTLADLLGIEAGAAETLAADDRVDGFDNNAAALAVGSLYADQLRTLAEGVAFDANLTARLPCDPMAEGQAPCAARFIEDFGLRAFRRPLTQDDVDRYVALWETVAAEEGFLDGLRWVVAAMLQSPHFLYRMELGEKDGSGTFALTGWEIATELSYLYWRTTPDEALLAAAESGALSTADGLAEQVARLAADPRASETVADFVDAWLELDQLATVSRDATTYPDFTTDIRAAMGGETRRLVADIATDGDLGDLFLARHTFVTPALAVYYGLPIGTGDSDAGGYQRVELDGETRGGLLTQGSLLARWALPTSSSPIHRGVMVRERMLCQELAPPPSNLDTSPPAVDPTLSTRERYAAHAALPECASCHDLIDPIGFGFEHYDGASRWRDQDGEHTVDATGEILSAPRTDGTFDGLFGLAELLAESPDVQACYATMWTVWGTGMADTESLACAAEQLADATPAGTLGLLAPRDALLGFDHFTRRTGESAELNTPAGGARLTDIVLPRDDGPWLDIPWDTESDVDWSEETYDWGSGYCTTLTITNVDDTEVVWHVLTDVPGAISSSWCVTMTAAGDDTLLTGSSSCGNETLAAGGVTSAGWCATY
jgi:hypothetical protein